MAGKPKKHRNDAGKRPSLGITPEVIERFAGGVRLGMSFELAAHRAGIGECTYYAWRRRGKAEPDSLYGELNRAVSAALADGAQRALENIDAAGSEDWRASAWILERRYGYTPKQVLAGDPEAPLRLTITELVAREAERDERQLEDSSGDEEREARALRREGQGPDTDDQAFDFEV